MFPAMQQCCLLVIAQSVPSTKAAKLLQQQRADAVGFTFCALLSNVKHNAQMSIHKSAGMEYRHGALAGSIRHAQATNREAQLKLPIPNLTLSMQATA